MTGGAAQNTSAILVAGLEVFPWISAQRFEQHPRKRRGHEEGKKQGTEVVVIIKVADRFCGVVLSETLWREVRSFGTFEPTNPNGTGSAIRVYIGTY